VTFDRLSTEHQRFLSTLHTLTNELDKTAFRALELEDFFALDLENLINSAKGLENNHNLLRRIDGYSQVYQADGVYQFKVVGNAFGPAFVCDATVNGVAVLGLDKTTARVHEFGFSVPVSALNGVFADDQVKRVSFEVVSRKEPGGNPIFKHSGEILLLPKRPVRCVLKETRAEVTWSKDTYETEELSRIIAIGETADVTVTVPEGCKIAVFNDPDKKCHTVVTCPP
jgi:hypothetical protein